MNPPSLSDEDATSRPGAKRPIEPQIFVAHARYLTVKGASAAMGLTESSIRKRLERGIWLEKMHWRKSPDGRIWIDMRAVQAWIESS